jgi:DNA-binding MarR family transcriptional regulator
MNQGPSSPLARQCTEGLAKRLRDPNDRRAFAVILTTKARALVLDEQSRALEKERTAPHSAAKRDALLKALQRVSAAVGLIRGVHPRTT